MCGIVGLSFAFHECFRKSAGYESVFFARYGRCYILVAHFLYAAHELVTFGKNFVSIRAFLNQRFHFMVMLHKLYGKIAWRKMFSHIPVCLKHVFEHCHSAFNIRSKVHMHVTHILVLPLIYIYDRIKQFVHSLAGTRHCGHHRHAYHFAQQLVVKYVAVSFQLVIHIQGYHHRTVHVNKLSGEIQIALNVGAVHDVEDGVSSLR